MTKQNSYISTRTSNTISNNKLLIFVLLIILSMVSAHGSTTPQTVKKLILSQVQRSKYALKAEIANLKVHIMAHLSDEQDWVKQDGCVVCEIGDDKDKANNDGQNCKNSCFTGAEEYGVKCSKSYCKKLTPEWQKSLTYNIKQGTRVKLTIKQSSSGQKFTYPTILASKMSHKYAEMGRINLLNGNKGLFGDQVIIVKDHDSDVSVYYYDRAGDTSNQNEQQQDQGIPKKDDKSKKSKQKVKQKSTKQSLLKDVNIIVDSTAKQKQKTVGLVLSNSNQIQNQQNTAINRQNQEDDDEQEQQEQQQINLFEISQIKLRQLYKNQQAPVVKTKKSKKNAKKQQNEQSAIASNLLPYTSEIPLIKTSAQFSIKTDKLLLPPLIYKKFTNLLIDKYFTSPQSQQSKSQCQFEDNYLKCQNKSLLNLQKLDNVTITLTVNGIQLQFPLRVLVQSCKQKSCSFLIGVSKNKKSVIIGDFILNIFALKYQKKLNKFTLYRLNNQWAQNFKQFRQYSQHQVNFIWMLLTLAFKALWWLFKIILFFACLSLGINCLYHWREVHNWFMEIFAKLANKDTRQMLHQKNLKNIGKLKKGINKMKVRIKDRIQTALHKGIPHQQLGTHVEFEGDELDYDDHQHNKQTVQLMRVDELSDRDSNYDSESDHQHQHTQAKQLNKNIIQVQKQRIKPANFVTEPIKAKQSQNKNNQTVNSITSITDTSEKEQKINQPNNKQKKKQQKKKQQKNKQPYQAKNNSFPDEEQFYQFTHNENQFSQF